MLQSLRPCLIGTSKRGSSGISTIHNVIGGLLAFYETLIELPYSRVPLADGTFQVKITSMSTMAGAAAASTKS